MMPVTDSEEQARTSLVTTLVRSADGVVRLARRAGWAALPSEGACHLTARDTDRLSDSLRSEAARPDLRNSVESFASELPF
jgi:hypothetical protein